jgi:3-oxoadipate enol-lactonase
MPKATVNGVELHYEDEGDGPALLLISGLGGNRLAWATVVPQFRDRYRCITFDNRGVGESEVPAGPYTIDQMADDAAALIDHLGLDTVSAVGWSMGGSILQSLLIRHGSKLNRAVLLSTLPSYTDIQSGWLDALLALSEAEVDPLARGIVGMPWAFTPQILANHSRAFEFAQLAQQNPYPTSFEGYAAQAAAIRVYDSRPELPNVATPTLVLVGAEDILSPVHQAAEIAALIPEAKLVVLPRGGHAMVLEYQPDTLREISAFLEAG